MQITGTAQVLATTYGTVRCNASVSANVTGQNDSQPKLVSEISVSSRIARWSSRRVIGRITLALTTEHECTDFTLDTLVGLTELG